MKQRYFGIAALMVFAAIVASLATSSTVAHAGQSARSITLFLVGPGLMTVVLALFILLPRASALRGAIETFEETYYAVMLIIVTLLGYTFAVLLWTSATPAPNAARALLGGAAMTLIFMGNLLGRVRANVLIGIRTRWTLASPRTWYATHRFASKVTVIAGFLALFATIVDIPFATAAFLLPVGPVLAVIYSAVYYTRLERNGELDVA